MASNHDQKVSLTVLTIVAVIAAAGVAAASLPAREAAPALPRVITARPAEAASAVLPAEAAGAPGSPKKTAAAQRSTPLPEVPARASVATIGIQAEPKQSAETTVPQREVVQPGVREQAVQVAQPARREAPRARMRVRSRAQQHNLEATSRDEHPRHEEKRCGYSLSKTKTASPRSSRKG